MSAACTLQRTDGTQPRRTEVSNAVLDERRREGERGNDSAGVGIGGGSVVDGARRKGERGSVAVGGSVGGGSHSEGGEGVGGGVGVWWLQNEQEIRVSRREILCQRAAASGCPLSSPGVLWRKDQRRRRPNPSAEHLAARGGRLAGGCAGGAPDGWLLGLRRRSLVPPRRIPQGLTPPALVRSHA